FERRPARHGGTLFRGPVSWAPPTRTPPTSLGKQTRQKDRRVLLEQPQLIKQVHRDYFDAGAEIAITSSYQATPQGFAGRGIAEAEALELVALSVRLADE